MNFKRVDTAREKESAVRKVLGDSVAGVEMVDKAVKSITFRANGNTVRLRHNDYVGIDVLVPEQPERVTKYRVMASEVSGFALDEEFDDEYSAKEKKESLELSLNLPTGTLKVEPHESSPSEDVTEEVCF